MATNLSESITDKLQIRRVSLDRGITMALCYTPGYFDTRGVESEIHNAYLLKQLYKPQDEQVPFITMVVVAFADLADRVNFTSLISNFVGLFPMNYLTSSFIMVVNKFPADKTETYLKTLIGPPLGQKSLKGEVKYFIKFLRNNTESRCILVKNCTKDKDIKALCSVKRQKIIDKLSEITLQRCELKEFILSDHIQESFTKAVGTIFCTNVNSVYKKKRSYTDLLRRKVDKIKFDTSYLKNIKKLKQLRESLAEMIITEEQMKREVLEELTRLNL